MSTKQNKLIMENWRKFLKEEVTQEQEQEQSKGSWPSEPPKQIKIQEGSEFNLEQIKNLWSARFSTSSD